MKAIVRSLAFSIVLILAFFRASNSGGHHGFGTSQYSGRRTYQRSPEVRREFQRENPCPSTHKTTGPCSAYRVDHVIPLACGGPDEISNLQWQTVADAAAKDKWELNCKGHP